MGLYQGDQRLSGAGKSAYQQAVAGGYTGSEADFQSLLADASKVVAALLSANGILRGDGNGNIEAASTAQTTVASTETWTFTLEDGTTVTKTIPVVVTTEATS